MLSKNTERLLKRARYGYVVPNEEINKIKKLINSQSDLKFTRGTFPFNFNLALDRELIEPSGRYISVQRKDGGITVMEWQFKK